MVIADAHTGLKAVIGSVLLGAAWQRCCVHLTRKVPAVAPKGNSEMVAAATRTRRAAAWFADLGIRHSRCRDREAV
ncbi:MAG: transposase mutator type [Nocardioides sp.]|nr:transposase mutator type [Nocardioides sp.]